MSILLPTEYDQHQYANHGCSIDLVCNICCHRQFSKKAYNIKWNGWEIQMMLGLKIVVAYTESETQAPYSDDILAAAYGAKMDALEAWRSIDIISTCSNIK